MTLNDAPDGARGSAAFDEEDEFVVPRSARTRPPTIGSPEATPPPPRPLPPLPPLPGTSASAGGTASARPIRRTPLSGEVQRDLETGSSKELLANDVRCVFMGPPQAGKTTVVGGILQSCMQPPSSPDDHRLKLITDGKDTSDVVRETYARMRSGTGHMNATDSVHRYSFNVRVTRPGSTWRPPTHTEATLVVQDGPGGALFPDEVDIGHHQEALKDKETELLLQAKAAACLVLCVDATQRDTGVLLSQLPGRLRDLSDSDRGSPMPVLANWRHRAYAGMSRLWGGQAAAPDVLERWLCARRFLILLTKVDALAESAVGAAGEGPSAEALARAIDPVRQACEILGPVFLHQILRALNPQYQRGSSWAGGGLAVGVSSAWGFDRRTGRPFRANGTGGAGPAETRLNDWHPMGLRDALIFMVCGQAVGTVQMVDEETLMEHISGPLISAGDWFRRRPPIAGGGRGWL